MTCTAHILIWDIVGAIAAIGAIGVVGALLILPMIFMFLDR